ncbi:hypothetical protein [Actinoalloteichus hymeniacidonis]|uniref:Uncharacterized protein n=1 Tax=Actinoalloteichus hymeniacidonis TaxID=340345 RepID=A0AAC9HP04_9PSEU|nr:hypothetical protein [Actinoalloteichus hymeniacidonis]AOS62739.1 hypothetical protein TL08_09620 [Actinoalloteichus hymeniacidonis]MBB5909230.1 hypothetical protein [Actinoalloteichus hymeniacidonis]
MTIAGPPEQSGPGGQPGDRARAAGDRPPRPENRPGNGSPPMGPGPGRGRPTGCGLWITGVFTIVAGLTLWSAIGSTGAGQAVAAFGAALLFLVAFASAGATLRLGSGRSQLGCAGIAVLLLLVPAGLLLSSVYLGETSGVVRVLIEVVGWLLVLTWLLVTIIAFGLNKAERFVASLRDGAAQQADAARRTNGAGPPTAARRPPHRAEQKSIDDLDSSARPEDPPPSR